MKQDGIFQVSENQNVPEFKYFKAENYTTPENVAFKQESYSPKEIQEVVHDGGNTKKKKQANSNDEQLRKATRQQTLSSGVGKVVSTTGTVVVGAAAAVTIFATVIVAPPTITIENFDYGSNYLVYDTNVEGLDQSLDYTITLSSGEEIIYQVPVEEGNNQERILSLVPETEYSFVLSGQSNENDITDYYKQDFTTRDVSYINALFDVNVSFVEETDLSYFSIEYDVFVSDANPENAYFLCLIRDDEMYEQAHNTMNNTFVGMFSAYEPGTYSLAVYSAREVDGEPIKTYPFEVDYPLNVFDYYEYSFFDETTEVMIAGYVVGGLPENDYYAISINEISDGNIINTYLQALVFDEYYNFELFYSKTDEYDAISYTLGTVSGQISDNTTFKQVIYTSDTLPVERVIAMEYRDQIIYYVEQQMETIFSSTLYFELLSDDISYYIIDDGTTYSNPIYDSNYTVTGLDYDEYTYYYQAYDSNDNPIGISQSVVINTANNFDLIYDFDISPYNAIMTYNEDNTVNLYFMTYFNNPNPDSTINYQVDLTDGIGNVLYSYSGIDPVAYFENINVDEYYLEYRIFAIDDTVTYQMFYDYFGEAMDCELYTPIFETTISPVTISNSNSVSGDVTVNIVGSDESTAEVVISETDIIEHTFEVLTDIDYIDNITITGLFNRNLEELDTLNTLLAEMNVTLKGDLYKEETLSCDYMGVYATYVDQEVLQSPDDYTLYNVTLNFDLNLYGDYVCLIDDGAGTYDTLTTASYTINGLDVDAEYVYYYQIYNGDEIPVTERLAINISTTIPSVDYTINTKNPSDAIVSYNEDGTTNIYIATEFVNNETATISQRVELFTYDGSSEVLAYTYNGTDSIVYFENILADSYTLRYYVLVTIDNATYSVQYTYPSGSVDTTFPYATYNVEGSDIGITYQTLSSGDITVIVTATDSATEEITIPEADVDYMMSITTTLTSVSSVVIRGLFSGCYNLTDLTTIENALAQMDKTLLGNIYLETEINCTRVS